MTSDVFVSIVVCTRNRHEDLARCLKALSKIDYVRREILVIDNSTNPSTVALNAKSSAAISARYFYEPRRGLSVARNRGITETKGQLIAFTDDDCVPDNQWLKKALKNFNDLDVACCTGRTVSFMSDSLSATFEKYYGFDRGSTRQTFQQEGTKLNLGFLVKALPYARQRRITQVAPPPFSVGLGNNMIFKREVFNAVGYFDERLGAGTPTEAGDETDIFYRILKAGKKIVYEPEAIVFHKHRQTYAGLVKAVYVCGLGVSAFLRKHVNFGDIQAAVFYIGRLVNLMFAVNSYKRKREKEIAYLTFVELKGWIRGFLEYW